MTTGAEIVAFIKGYVHRFGGRLAASEQEQAAQEFFRDQISVFCNRTLLEPFRVKTGAMFQSLKIFVLLFFISLFIYPAQPWWAFSLSLVNVVLFIGHFLTYHYWLDFLFPSAESCNVQGIILPKEEVKQRIVISGHMDSTREFIWWYLLKQAGIALMVVAGVAMCLLPVFILLSVLQPSLQAGIWGFVFLSPATLTFFFIHGRKVVQGAQDNLSGVAIAYFAGKYFSEERLTQTEVRVVSFGSEEPCLRGSAAYVAAHEKELKAIPTLVINIDGVRLPDQIHLLPSEPMNLTRHHAPSVNDFLQVYRKTGKTIRRKPLVFGGTDAVPFSRKKIPAFTIIGISMDRLDPTYHTRLDTPENLHPQALFDVWEAIVNYCQKADIEGLPN